MRRPRPTGGGGAVAGKRNNNNNNNNNKLYDIKSYIISFYFILFEDHD